MRPIVPQPITARPISFRWGLMSSFFLAGGFDSAEQTCDGSRRHCDLISFLSMIFSENRFPLFRIMLYTGVRNFLSRSCTADSDWLLSGRLMGSPDSAERSAPR